MNKEIHETSNLKRDLQFPFYTEKVEFEAGEYKMGDLVELTVAGKVKKLNTAAEIYGVVTDDFKVDTNNKKSTVYLTGSFNEKYIGFNGKDKAEVKKAARKLLIMIG
jgi:hypothetical protein